ncbi:MAG: ABC transporter substrate-binding protein [Pikeienuella sp.]
MSDRIWNHISRRRLLGALPAAAVLPSLSPLAAQAQAPQRGGTLRIGLQDGSSDNSLDPVTYVDSSTYMIGLTLGNCLTELTPQKEPIPELAESWESSDGAKRWAFRIRQGVEFHDGRTLTPADVVYSLNRHIGDDSQSSAKAFLADVTRIYADGRDVIIEHASGDADIPQILADFHFIILPEGFTDWANFVGTGPYILESYEPGGRFAATRNPNYWKAGRAWFDRVEARTIPDLAAREAALAGGQVDFIDGVNFLVFDRYKSNPAFVAQESVGSRYVSSVMDVRSEPFSNPQVRLALKHAVPRQQIIEKVLGYAVAGNDHPVPPSDPFFHTELPQREFDPDRASFHLREAGLGNLSISLSAADAAFTGAVDAGILLSDTAGIAGMSVNVLPEADDQYWTEVWMAKPFTQAFWFVRPTPGMMFSVAFACEAAWNDAYWCDDRFGQLLRASRVETDFERRRQIFWDLQEITHFDGGVIIPAFLSDLEIYAERVMGLEPTAFGRLCGFRIAERGWFA